MHLNSVIALDFLTICGIHVLINRSKIWSIYRCKVTAVVHIQPAIKDDNILVETHERPSDYCQENSSLPTDSNITKPVIRQFVFANQLTQTNDSTRVKSGIKFSEINSTVTPLENIKEQNADLEHTKKFSSISCKNSKATSAPISSPLESEQYRLCNILDQKSICNMSMHQCYSPTFCKLCS